MIYVPIFLPFLAAFALAAFGTFTASVLYSSRWAGPSPLRR